ncbi:probable E3 ubiquitin-protein ligase RHY1A [Cornus florida]|uniref:probable E3 ubiquitin-protein ligase RHY1A n=1 Tax=Cornus florida TaxID=4283 RepID=UPI00289722E7|nr:probable E3 ubiquitin-protein ligase RHY1A [Cornus florida]
MPSCVIESNDLSRRFFNHFVFRLRVTRDDWMYHNVLSSMRAIHHHRSGIPDNTIPAVVINIVIETSSDEEIDDKRESHLDDCDDLPLIRILQASMTRMARAIQESMYVGLKPVPASQSSIDALEKTTFYRSCTICLEEFSDEQSIIRMPCSHIYHGECITKWLKMNHSCPLCRFKMPTS